MPGNQAPMRVWSRLVGSRGAGAHNWMRILDLGSHPYMDFKQVDVGLVGTRHGAFCPFWGHATSAVPPCSSRTLLLHRMAERSTKKASVLGLFM